MLRCFENLIRYQKHGTRSKFSSVALANFMEVAKTDTIFWKSLSKKQGEAVGVIGFFVAVQKNNI